MRKKSTLVTIPSVWCFLKSTGPVYYQLLLNLIKTSLKIIFLQKKSNFLHFQPKNRGLKDNFFWKTAKRLPIKLHIYRQKIILML